MGSLEPCTTDRCLAFGQALLPHGWARDVRVSIRNGRIAAIAENRPPQPDDERHDCALPGMPNVHSHAFQRAMAGLAECRGPANDTFWTWRDAMYRIAGRITPDELQAIAALAYCEMLESGFTRVGEFHYLHHGPGGEAYADPAEMSRAIVAACEESGIGLTLLPVFYAHSGFGGAAPTDGQARFASTLSSFARLLESATAAAASLPDSVVGIAPHSLRAVTAAELQELQALCPSGPVHIHIAEQIREVDECLAWSGQRPVEWLLNHAKVDARWCLIHATHVNAAELRRIAATGAVAGLCPITEANLGDGLFPAPAFLDQGGRFGIGSDSNVLIDMSEELRLLEYGQRIALRERNVLARQAGRSTGAELYRNALTGGGIALGHEPALSVGQPADLVSLDLSHATLHGRSGDVLLDGLVFAAGRTAIDCVWRNGTKLVSDGRHRARDAIGARYARVLEKLTE